jgi:2-polyprenyl-3-methyl-5-hydroxy-6-metoxy-1,4-benzoquinol methylase
VPFDRRHSLLAGLDRGMKLVEIGASYNPLVPRSEGWNVVVVDHADRAELAAKYEHEPSVDVSRIEDVDVVWTAGSLAAAVPAEHHGTIDAVIASHVIEHLPDPVGFLRSVELLLAPGGRLVLAVPDMRACFDLLRPPTTTGNLVEAHVLCAERHSLSSLFDSAAYTVLLDGAITWSVGAHGALTYQSPFDRAREAVTAYRQNEPEYVDCHAWQYTPASFELALLELAALGLTTLVVTSRHDTVGCEFYVTLRAAAGPAAVGPELDDRRLYLRRRALAELGRAWAGLEPE